MVLDPIVAGPLVIIMLIGLGGLIATHPRRRAWLESKCHPKDFTL